MSETNFISSKQLPLTPLYKYQTIKGNKHRTKEGEYWKDMFSNVEIAHQLKSHSSVKEFAKADFTDLTHYAKQFYESNEVENIGSTNYLTENTSSTQINKQSKNMQTAKSKSKLNVDQDKQRVPESIDIRPKGDLTADDVDDIDYSKLHGTDLNIQLFGDRSRQSKPIITHINTKFKNSIWQSSKMAINAYTPKVNSTLDLLMKHQPLTQRATSTNEDIYLIDPKGKSRSQHTKQHEGDEDGRNIQSTQKWKNTDIITSNKIRALKKKAANKTLHTKSTQKFSVIDLPAVDLKRNFGQMKYSKEKKIGRGRNTEKGTELKAFKTYDTATKNTKEHEDLDSEYILGKDNIAGDSKSITSRALIEARNIEHKLVEQMKPQNQKDFQFVIKSRMEEGIKMKNPEVNVNNQPSPKIIPENNIKISTSNIPNELGYIFGDEKIQLKEEYLTPRIPRTPANPEESDGMGMEGEIQTKEKIKSAALLTPIQTPSRRISESNNLSRYMKRSDHLRDSKSPKEIIESEDRYIDLTKQILKDSQSKKILLKNSDEKIHKEKPKMEKRKPKNQREYCKFPILRPSILTFEEDAHPNAQSYSIIKAVRPSYQNLSKWFIPPKHWNNRMQHKIFEVGSRPPLHKTFTQNSTIAKLDLNLRKQDIFEENVILEDKEEIPGGLARMLSGELKLGLDYPSDT